MLHVRDFDDTKKSPFIFFSWLDNYSEKHLNIKNLINFEDAVFLFNVEAHCRMEKLVKSL